jgi:hypothetical protein
MKKIIALIVCLPLSFVFAQTDTTVNKASSFSFSDVDEKPTKRYCTQKVLNQTPNRFISIGYEYQGGFDFKATPSPFNETLRYDNASGMRVGFYTPIVSKNNLIINLAGNYWRTAFNGPNYSFPYPLYQSLNNNGLHSAGVSLTVFKPLNEKKFLLFQAIADANWQMQNSGLSITNKALTYSGSVVYGWKPTENLMWGIGVSRTYRLGRPIIIPVILYNQTFNDKWGIESVFPAKAAVRRNINKKSMIFAGYELEGNQYAIYNGFSNTSFLQRGEIKTRLTYERSLFGFWWISIQSGIRTNGRFNVVDRYNGGKDNEAIKTTLGNALYFNISLNLVSL